MKYEATTVDGYINQIPEDRKDPISKLRQVILDNILKDLKKVLTIK